MIGTALHVDGSFSLPTFVRRATLKDDPKGATYHHKNRPLQGACAGCYVNQPYGEPTKWGNKRTVAKGVIGYSEE